MPLQEHGISLTRENNDIEELSIDSYSLLSAPNTNGTTISNRYWLDNNSVSLTNDALVKSGKALILKAGINYNYNDNELQQNANEVFFFGQDSTVINRKVKNKLTSNAYYIGLVQEINNEKLYLKNKTTINEERSSGFSNVVQNDNYLKYLYTDENLALKNTTEFKTIINNKIINSGLLLEYITNRESNDVIPSVFINEIPNSGIPYQTNQTINTKQFSFGAYSSYNFKIKNSNAQIKQRINWSNESLNSNVQQYSDTPEEELPFPFTSDFRLNTFESLTTFKSVFTIKDVTITLNPELKYINLKKQELLAQDLDNQNDFIFLQPRTSFKYKIDHQWTASLTGNYLSSVSRFPQLFNAVILRDYGNLYRNPNETNVTQTGIGTLYFGYSNILKGFLFSNSTSLSRSESDFIFSSSIDSNGLVQIEAVKGSNERNDFTNTTNLTKRFFRILKTDLNYKFNQATDNQIFNTIQQETLSTNHSLEVNLNIDNNTWYGFNYNGDFIFGKTKSNEFITSNTFINHTLELDFYTSSKTRINLGTESVFSSYSSSDVNSKNTLFNAEFYYKPSKKLFLRASFNNIFNEKFFTTIQSNSNLVARSQFKLRPRQFTIGLNYSF